MSLKTLTANKGTRLHKLGGFNSGAGKAADAPVGYESGTGELERYVLGFPALDIVGLKVFKINGVKLHLRNNTPHKMPRGGSPRVKVRRTTTAWTEGTSVEPSSGNALIWPGPTSSATNAVNSATLSTANDAWNAGIDVTQLYCDGLPATVKRPDGSPCAGNPMTGLVLMGPDDDATSTPATGGWDTTDNTEFWSEDASSSHPYLIVDYSSNQPPSMPILVTPADGDTVSTVTGTEMTVRGSISDADLNAYIKKARVQVFPVGTTDAQANSGAVVALNDVRWTPPVGTQPKLFTVRVGVNTPGFTDPPLTRRTARQFRTQVTDNANAEGAWTLLADGDFTPNATPLLTNPVVTRNTRTPDFYASIADPDAILGGTNGTITAMQYYVWTTTPSGAVNLTPNSAKQPIAGNPVRAFLAWAGSDPLDWNADFWATFIVWDDADVPSVLSAKVYFTPRQVLGPQTMLPSGIETKQNTVTPAFTVGDVGTFDKFTMRFWRDADVLVPFHQQTHTTLTATLAAVPTGTTNVRVTVAGTAAGLAIPNVAIGDIIRISKAGGLYDDRTVTAVGTTGAAGTGLTFSATVLAASHAIGDTARTIQATRTYAGPTGIAGNDWGTTPYWSAAVEPTGAAAYLVESQRIPYYINADPSAPSPVSVVDSIDSLLGYRVIPDTTPVLRFPFVDPDKTKGYTEAPTRREIELDRFTTVWAPVAGSPVVITSGITDDYTTAALVLNGTYRARARYDDSAARRGIWSEYVVFKPTALPVVGVVAPAAAAVVTDPTTLVDWTFAGSGGKLQAYYRVVLEETTGDPYILYDSGKTLSAASELILPSFQEDEETPLLATGQAIRATVQVWDTDQVTASTTWSWTTSFTEPAAITALTAVPDAEGSLVTLSWTGADANRVEYRIYRRATGGEFVRIDPGCVELLTYTDYEANVGASLDYRVTQHTGALESPIGEDSQATTYVGGDLFLVEAPDGTMLREIHYVTDWTLPDQNGDVMLRPLPGDDGDAPAFPIPLSGGDTGQQIRLTIAAPTDEPDQVPYLRDLRHQVRHGNIPYIVLKSPDGRVWRVQFANIDEGSGSIRGHRAVTLTADEIA